MKIREDRKEQGGEKQCGLPPLLTFTVSEKRLAVV